MDQFRYSYSRPSHAYNLHQLPVAGHHVVFHVFGINLAVDLREELAGTFDFRMLDGPKFHAGHRAFGLGDEIDVLDRAFPEGNGPVRVVVAYGSWNQEASGELCIDDHLGAGIQLFHKLPLNLGVGDHVVIDVVLQLLAGLGEVLLALACGENIDIVGLGNVVVAQPLDDDRGLLLIDKS